MERKWFKEGFVYQIYPKSFMDTNNDGIGDLQGIIAKIPYLKELGIDIIWLSPIYVSPMADNGYDIADYKNIDPLFGTMDDFDMMMTRLKDANIKLIMDLVVNHTSDEHFWFKEACKGKDNPYHDYYLFKDKPNNWTSFFGGSTWEYVKECDEYYLHLFSKKQPDLNWENPKVREEVKNILRFWLDKGVAGFRCDVINLLSKNDEFPEGIEDGFLVGKEHYINGPKIHDYLRELNEDVLSKYDCFTVGECGVLNPETALTFIGENKKELNMVFHFDHMAVDGTNVKWIIKKFKNCDLKNALSRWQYGLAKDGWNSLYFENHDQPRSVSRFGNENYRVKSAMMLAMFLFLQKGTCFIYQGEEIGMTNANFTDINDYKDIESFDIYKTGIEKYGFSKEKMLESLRYISRDNARTPMQWDDSINGGFTKGVPWIRVNSNYKMINVKKDQENKDSIYRFYKKLIALKKKYIDLLYGDYLDYYKEDDNIICYKRYGINKQIFIVCNYSDKKIKIDLPFRYNSAIIILNNYMDNEIDIDDFLPYQGKVYLITEE